MNELVTKIWVRNNWKNINPDNAPRELRELDSFLAFNSTAKCILKGQGGYYRIKDGILHFISRTLSSLSFKDWLIECNKQL